MIKLHLKFRGKALKILAIGITIAGCVSVVNADDSPKVNTKSYDTVANSAMSSISPMAESDNSIMTGRMFVSKAEEDSENIDVSSMLTDDYWDEVESVNLKVSDSEFKTYKQAMIDKFVDAETQRQLQELRDKYPNAVYDDCGKLVVKSYDVAAGLDIRTESNWTLEDFKLVCTNPEIQDLLPVAVRIEDETGTNALYLVSVAICETGWGKHMAGSYNYFNWSSHGVQSFASIDDFADYSVDRYAGKYTKESTYGTSLITPRVVNRIYAINGDGSVNWNWSEHVCSMMAQLSNARQGN